MNLKKHTWVVAFAAISAVTATVSLTTAQSIQDDPSSAMATASPQTVQGVWRTVVTPYNCQTGQPILSLSGLFTFHQGGTMSEYGIGPGATPALRSPGHGVWQREHGWQEYSLAFTFYRYSATGVLLGSQRIRAALELGAGGDGFASRSAIETLDANDEVIGRGCATSIGTRFQ